MKRPPDKFIQEYETFRERWRWAQRGIDDNDLVAAQSAHAGMTDFLDRWQGNVGVPEFEEAMALLRPHAEMIGRLLESKFLEALRDLVEKRHSLLIEPKMFDLGIKFLKVMEVAPPPLRPSLEQIFREDHGYDYDPERFYRESEAEAEVCAADYNQALLEMGIVWGDRLTPALRQRLASADLPEVNRWRTEVAQQLAAAMEAAMEAAEPVGGDAS